MAFPSIIRKFSFKVWVLGALCRVLGDNRYRYRIVNSTLCVSNYLLSSCNYIDVMPERDNRLHWIPHVLAVVSMLRPSSGTRLAAK